MFNQLVFGLSLVTMLNTAAEVQVPKSGDFYKIERVMDLQNYALEQGIEPWKLKPMLGWFYAETATLSEHRRGDSGWSVGICQCHTYWRDCVFTYEEQREQCISWFIGYTWNSTPQTIYRDIRKGHNFNGGADYENKIKRKENYFTPAFLRIPSNI